MPTKMQALKPYLRLMRNPGWLCFAWFGMTAGISLLEAPVKFTAPLISRDVALDVGRVVFAALNKAELAALVVTLVLVRASGLSRLLWAPTFALALILILQSVWLLPELSQRSLKITQGIQPGESPAHLIYGLLELSKLLLLLIIGFRAWRHAGRVV